MKGKRRAREGRGDPRLTPGIPDPSRPGHGGRRSCRRGCGGDDYPERARCSPGPSEPLRKALMGRTEGALKSRGGGEETEEGESSHTAPFTVLFSLCVASSLRTAGNSREVSDPFNRSSQKDATSPTFWPC